MSRLATASMITMMMAVLPNGVFAQASDDLAEISLESLLDIKVTSVSRHQEELRKTAAAAYVLTSEDIRQSGVTDIPDLLRMVPGVEVAHVNSSIWAVSVRGFNEQYANKLLVLVDGRSVYDPAFSGVYWNLQNLILEDIERIEVIRGPGATMWGANAVNGVISITTKRASDTQGGLVVVDSGSDRPAEGSFRFGGSLGSNAFYRFSVNQKTRDPLLNESGGEAGDPWNLTRGTIRLDWERSARDSFSFEGSAYRGVAGSDQRNLTSLTPVTYKDGLLFGETGGHLLTRWSRSLGNDSNLTAKFYYDGRRHDGFIGRDMQTWDFDLQHDFKIGGNRHDIVWGVGHREVRDAFRNSLGVGFDPDRKSSRLSNAFLQSTLAVVPDQLYITAGSKVEHNSYTGFEIQPALRVLWAPGSRHSAWTSLSRAVRTANRADRDLRINAALVPMGRNSGLITILGQDKTRSENLAAYETGYRYQANRRLWLDITAFYNVYKHLATVEAGTPFFESSPAPAHLAIPSYFDNLMDGEAYGAEVAASYRVRPFWSLKGSYSRLRLALHPYANSNDPEAEEAEGRSPENQFHIASFFTLPKSFELAAHAYFVGGLRSFQIPQHTRLDLNLTWKRLENVELKLVGQDLLGTHMEFGESAGLKARAVGRSAYARIAWRF